MTLISIYLFSFKLKEELKSFLTDALMGELREQYVGRDVSMGEAEQYLAYEAGQEAHLLGQDKFYPIQIFTRVSRHFI
jgi:hypothetical protein